MKLDELLLSESFDTLGFEMLEKALNSGAKIWFSQQPSPMAGTLVRVSMEEDTFGFGAQVQFVNFDYKFEQGDKRAKRAPDLAVHTAFTSAEDFDERVVLKMSKRPGYKWDLVLKRRKPKLKEAKDQHILVSMIEKLLQDDKPVYIRMNRGFTGKRKTADAQVFGVSQPARYPDEAHVTHDERAWLGQDVKRLVASIVYSDDWTISKEGDRWIVHKM